MSNVREILNAAKAQLLGQVAEIDAALAALNAKNPPAPPKKAASKVAKRVVTPETRAKMKASHAARKARKMAEANGAHALPAE